MQSQSSFSFVPACHCTNPLKTLRQALPEPKKKKLRKKIKLPILASLIIKSSDKFKNFPKPIAIAAKPAADEAKPADVGKFVID